MGALSSDRPLHRAFACAIGFLQVNHKALHAFALMGANAEAQRISHWDEPSGPLASEHEHECCVGCPSTSGGLTFSPTKEPGHGHSSPQVGCAFLGSACLYKLSRHKSGVGLEFIEKAMISNDLLMKS